MRLISKQFGSGKVFHQGLIFSLLAALVTPVHVFGDEPAAPRGADVVLQESGSLRGSVVNELGQPIAAAKVQVLQGDRVVATTTSNEEGRFAVRSLRNGTHVIRVEGAAQVVRFWSETAAPPTAINDVTIVVQPDALVRGQAASTPGLLTNPWFIAGVVGVTVGTIMIVENQNDDDASP